VEVADDGRGLRAPVRQGAGVAVANIRERLRARYGSQAQLELVDNDPGACARLTLPVPTPNAA
jgi:LytS/YehU family sensor histidine kinase